MIISVINEAFRKIADEEILHVVRAINRQIAYDFEPYWSLGATLRLEGRSGRPDKQSPADMRGDAIIYLWDEVDIDNALGYHDTNHRGIPYGFVFTELSRQLGEHWSVTLSHEALELIGDPEVNLLVQGPHPADPKKVVFHWYEMCDAVQAETYKLDGVEVANFVLPLYFTGSEEIGGRNDFLSRKYKKAPLRSFSINPGGYIGFFNPETNAHETFAIQGDAKAAKRIQIKQAAGQTRRTVRRGPEAAERKDVSLPRVRLVKSTKRKDTPALRRL
jgi:hypothetical protein